MRVANIISIIRALLLPLIIYLVLQKTEFTAYLALVILSFAILSDILDGFVARQNKITQIGSFLDSFADAVLIFGLLIFFTIAGDFSAIILITFLIRDMVAIYLKLAASREDIILRGRRLYSVSLLNSQYALCFGLLLQYLFRQDTLRFSQKMEIANGIILFFTFTSLLLAIVSLIHNGINYFQQIHQRAAQGKKIKQENIVILVNKRSRGYLNSYRRHLLEVFAKRRNAKIIHLPARQNMFADIEPKIKEYSHVIIAGGDGSFESAFNTPVLQKKTLGFFPLGAGNAYYSYFYKGKRFEYLRSRFPFHEVELDMVEITWDSGKRETTILSLGLDADVIRLSSTRTKHGFLDYVKGSWAALQQARAAHDLRCTIDGKEIHLPNCITATFGKVPYGGYAMRFLVGKIKPDDGNVYGTFCVNTHAFFNKPVRIIGMIIGLLNMDKSPLLSVKGKEIIITCDTPFSLQAGGEFLGESTSLKMTIRRKQKVLVV